MSQIQRQGETPDDASGEAFVDEVVSSYIQDQIAAGEAAGKSREEIEQSFQVSSLILTVRMLQAWNDGPMPEGAELLRGLGEVTGASDAECRELCRVFILAGWLDAGYCLTPRGRELAGLGKE